MALPSSGLTVSAVNSALGAGSYSVGVLCTSARINKWSKNKPIRLNKTSGVTATERYNANYGLSVPTAKGTAELTKSDSYSHAAPRGSSYNEPYRLGDFREYDHSCNPPCKAKGDREFNILFIDSITLDYSNTTDVMSTYGIQLGDIAALQDMYIAVVFTDASGNTWYKTTANTVANGGGTLTLSKTELPTTTDGTEYTYYLVAVSAKKETIAASAVSSTWMLLPCDKVADLLGVITFKRTFPITMTPTMIASGNTPQSLMTSATNYVGVISTDNVNNSAYYFQLDAATYTLQLKYTLTNMSTEAVTLKASNFRFKLNKNFYSTSGVADQPLTMYDGTTEITEVTIPASGSKEVTIMFNPGAFRMNTSGVQQNISTNQLLEVGITFSYNDVDNLRTTNVRLKNYS